MPSLIPGALIIHKIKDIRMNIPNESNLNFEVSVFLCNKEKYKIRIINENKKLYNTVLFISLSTHSENQVCKSRDLKGEWTFIKSLIAKLADAPLVADQETSVQVKETG